MAKNINNKRIAKNTVIIYIRLCVTMIVGLVTSRYVLLALGVSNFGLYNVVGSILAMLSFITGSLTITTTRFINFEEGKENGDTNKIFNTCLVIHIIVAMILLLLAETLGVFYIKNYLKVSPGMEGAAMFVYQISVIVACIGMINIPYQGLLVAKEKFNITATVDIINVIVKLLLVMSLFLFKSYRLQIYAIFMSVMTFISFVAYHWVCMKRWPEIVKKNFKGIKRYFKDIVVFNNYNLAGSLSLTLRDQGSNIIINYFFNTSVNAAYAVARSVQGYVNNFTANIDVAAAPQITQNYSGGNKTNSEILTGIVGRICMLMMLLVFFPLIIELDFILHLWLGGNVPEGTTSFTYLTLCLVYVGATSAGLTQYINASGKIKWFKIQFSILYLLCLPGAFILFKFGYAPWTIIVLFIIADILSRVNQFILLRKITGFNSLGYMKEAYTRPLAITAIVALVSLMLHCITPDTDLYKVINIVSIFFIVLALDLTIGLKPNERKKILSTVKNKLKIR